MDYISVTLTRVIQYVSGYSLTTGQIFGVHNFYLAACKLHLQTRFQGRRRGLDSVVHSSYHEDPVETPEPASATSILTRYASPKDAS